MDSLLRVSVIIPAFNEERVLPATLAHMALCGGAHEVIVVDCGSTDATAEIAQEHGATVIQAPRGRGNQLAAGAKAATGDILWFVHADVLVPPNAIAHIRAAVSTGACAGNFKLQFTGNSAGARFTTAYQPVLRALGWIYGDSAIFATKDAYLRAGGFGELPIFEDVDFVRRVRPLGAFVTAPEYVTTSSRRFEHRYLRTFALWTLLQTLFSLGVSPHRLARMYRNAR